jgi:hypothetical protein
MKGHTFMIGLLFILLLPVNEKGIAAECVGNNVLHTRLVMKFRVKFFNYHAPIQNLLGLDIVVDHVLVISEDANGGAPE